MNASGFHTRTALSQKRATNGLFNLLILGIVALLMLSLSACDSSGPGGDPPEEEEPPVEEEPPAAGTFTSTVDGDLSEMFSGEALQGTVEGNLPGVPDQVEVFEVGMVEDGDADTTAVELLRLVPDSPSEGSYDIGNLGDLDGDFDDVPEDTFYGFFAVQSTPGTFFSSSGTLEITEVDGDQLLGNFEFDASSGSGTVSVEGRFNATRVENPGLPGARVLPSLEARAGAAGGTLTP